MEIIEIDGNLDDVVFDNKISIRDYIGNHIFIPHSDGDKPTAGNLFENRYWIVHGKMKKEIETEEYKEFWKS